MSGKKGDQSLRPRKRHLKKKGIKSTKISGGLGKCKWKVPSEGLRTRSPVGNPTDGMEKLEWGKDAPKGKIENRTAKYGRRRGWCYFRRLSQNANPKGCLQRQIIRSGRRGYKRKKEHEKGSVKQRLTSKKPDEKGVLLTLLFETEKIGNQGPQ